MIAAPFIAALVILLNGSRFARFRTSPVLASVVPGGYHDSTFAEQDPACLPEAIAEHSYSHDERQIVDHLIVVHKHGFFPCDFPLAALETEAMLIPAREDTLTRLAQFVEEEGRRSRGRIGGRKLDLNIRNQPAGL